MSSCRPLLFIAALLVAGPPFLGLGLGKLANAKVSVSDEKTGEKLDAPCSKGCKAAYIGDKNCDMECYNEECDFDGGDCDDQWEIKRTIVMGAFYKDVDHVEYHAVGPGGQSRQLTMEEGRRWEGIDEDSLDNENDWKKTLEAGFEVEDEFESETWQVDVNPTLQGQEDPNYVQLTN